MEDRRIFVGDISFERGGAQIQKMQDFSCTKATHQMLPHLRFGNRVIEFANRSLTYICKQYAAIYRECVFRLKIGEPACN